MPRNRFIVVLSLALPAVAWGQVSNLDRGTLVEGLRREGMGELLKHLVESEPSNDPVLNKQILVAQLLLDYETRLGQADKAGDPEEAAKLRTEAVKAFTDALQERRNLIAQYASHEQRPLWQTDLAEQLLFEYLQVGRQNAAEFYEFGVPAAEQRDAFEKTVPEAFEQLSQADLRFFELQGDLPKEPDHTRKRIDTGLWDRMINQYYQLRTQYYLAHAAYYVSLLPDAHPYYKNLGNPRIPNQKRSPADERTRLRGLAVERLGKFAADASDQHNIRRGALSLRGRALSALGRHDEALAALDQAIGLPAPDAGDVPARLADLTARLGKAAALDRKGQGADAMAFLATLEGNSLVKEQLPFRVLLVDATHRLLFKRAQAVAPDKQPAAVADAYEPYQKLLSDPSLGERAEPLRRFVYRRWESSVAPDQDLSRMPPMVVAAMAETARDAGRDLEESAQAAEEAKDGGKASQLRAQAREKLDRAVKISEALIARKDAPPGIKAQGKYNLALASYYRNPRDVPTQITAARTLTEVADEFPDQSMSETAIGYAVGTLRALYDAPTPPSGVPDAYAKAASVLLAKYPATPAADGERVYYAAKVLAPAGRYTEAADVLARLPAAHPDYFAAQRDLVLDLQEAYRKAGDDQRDGLAKRAAAEATRVRHEAEAELPKASAERAPSVRQAAAWSRMVLADMAVEHDHKTDQALAYLQGFDRDFAGERDLIRPMLQRRIMALLGANKTDEAVAEATRMMKEFSDDAAPVIDRVLTELDRQIDALRRALPSQQVERIRQETQAAIKSKAESAVGLADMLRKWAADPARGLSRDDRLSIDLVYAKALRLAGRTDDALAVVEPLAQEFQDNAEVVFNAAEACYAAGTTGGIKNELLIGKAAPLYDRIITRVPAENNKYPPVWWNAWLRRLQISDAVNQNTADIPLLIRQLQNTDPNLGGDAFRGDFERLLNKWSGRK